MMRQSERYRYERVNIRPGWVMVEQEQFSGKHRAYFAEGPTPPREPYREGKEVWHHCADAQSMRFDIRDTKTDEVVLLDELLGLLYYACAKPGSSVYRLGQLAHESNVHVYIAIAGERAGGAPGEIPLEKLAVLNTAFNERLRTPNKRILILPDYFGLYREITFGEIMVDFGMTSMEAR